VKVFWTPEAEQERSEICAYIADQNPSAAAWMDKLFSDAAARLGKLPNIGRIGTIAGTRELIPHENYRLVSEIADETV
jgi:toxin ParE1/3/4